MAVVKQDGIPKYRAGGGNSVRRLEALGFNPIDQLVSTYVRLEEEIKRQEALRSGELKELTHTGRRRGYREETHFSLYDKLIAVSEKLLRYRYGRVPETDLGNMPKAAGALVIQLTQSQSGVYEPVAEPESVESEEPVVIEEPQQINVSEIQPVGPLYTSPDVYQLPEKYAPPKPMVPYRNTVEPDVEALTPLGRPPKKKEFVPMPRPK